MVLAIPLLGLLAITIGLLIALGLEATVVWLHHRSLVREAKENISHEIRDNRQKLATELNALPAEEKRLEEILTTVREGTRCQANRRLHMDPCSP